MVNHHYSFRRSAFRSRAVNPWVIAITVSLRPSWNYSIPPLLMFLLPHIAGGLATSLATDHLVSYHLSGRDCGGRPLTLAVRVFGRKNFTWRALALFRVSSCCAALRQPEPPDLLPCLQGIRGEAWRQSNVYPGRHISSGEPRRIFALYSMAI